MALTIKRTHTHNLNGHTAHAASKASRSQAYTLPLVALLSLLSASPTSSTPSPQFPSYWSASVKRAELSTCSRSTDEHRQADAQRPRTRARSMGNQPGGRQLAYNRRTGASRPGSHGMQSRTSSAWDPAITDESAALGFFLETCDVARPTPRILRSSIFLHLLENVLHECVCEKKTSPTRMRLHQI